MKNNIRFHVSLVLIFGLVSFSANAASVSGQGTWETTLQGRDLDGNLSTFEAYYDTTLDITWLADGNPTSASMNWSQANAWVAGLNVNGITGWRLPNNTPINGSTTNSIFTNNATSDLGYAASAGWVDSAGKPVSEMGHMYYVTLGNLGRCTPDNANPTGCTEQTGWGLKNSGPFSNTQSSFWSGGWYSPDYVWIFDHGVGFQTTQIRSNGSLAWAVHSGDVAAVPIPAAFWLFGSGLIGLVGVARKKSLAHQNS